MSDEEIQKSVNAFQPPRIPGKLIPFNQLKAGQKFMFQEISKLHECIVLYRDFEMIRYTRDNWKFPIKNDHPTWDKMVEV